ncbi:MAG TPA: BON domain-containing protein [Steroidobacteraceae bacterium]|nr:BON domain-containing protein [Steroidobacteraceae bacterium]
MKTSLAIATLVLGVSLTPAFAAEAPATEGTVDRSHPTTYVKDSAITAKIKAKLAAEHLSSLARVHVDTDADGKVYLSGSAPSQADIDKAVTIAQSTEHVVGVQNDLTVRTDK